MPSTKKTFKTKTAVKKARKKGQSSYKVKGGYRLTKPRKTKRTTKRKTAKRKKR